MGYNAFCSSIVVVCPSHDCISVFVYQISAFEHLDMFVWQNTVNCKKNVLFFNIAVSLLSLVNSLIICCVCLRFSSEKMYRVLFSPFSVCSIFVV